MPKASVTKPGVSISVPPTRMRAPSASSRAGIRPDSSATRSPCQALPPSRRISQVPNRLSRISSRIVHHGPMTWPTWISTQISTSGTPMKAANSAILVHRRRVAGRVIASSRGADARPAGSRTRGAAAPSR